MKGWVGLVGWPIADGLPTLVVTHQLQVKRRTGKVRRPETGVLPLCHAIRLKSTAYFFDPPCIFCVHCGLTTTTATIFLCRYNLHTVSSCSCNNSDRVWTRWFWLHAHPQKRRPQNDVDCYDSMLFSQNTTSQLQLQLKNKEVLMKIVIMSIMDADAWHDKPALGF